MFPVASAWTVAASLAYLAFRSGGVDPGHVAQVLAALAVLGLCMFWRPDEIQPSSVPVLCWAAVLAYLVMQIVPLPLRVIEILSPARAAMAAQIAGVLGGQSWSTLSISPADTFQYLFRMAGYLLVFLIARRMASGLPPAELWRMLLPFAVLGGIEATLGIAQFLVSSSSMPATGTYINRNHFGGLLGLLLPPALAQAAVSLTRAIRRVRSAPEHAHVLRACVWTALVTALLGGALCSLSRMTITSCTVSAMVTLYALYRPGLRTTVSMVVGVVLLVAVLIPGVFVERFATLTTGDGRDIGTRADLWKDSMAVVSAFRLTGSGGGTYSTALLPFKTVAPSFDVNFAHNDYIQHLSELGVVGVLPLVLLAAVVISRTFRSAWQASVIEERAVAAGCAGSMVSILIHSSVDFNLYIPANAALLAWIAGVAVALSHATNAAVPATRSRPAWIRLTRRRTVAGLKPE